MFTYQCETFSIIKYQVYMYPNVSSKNDSINWVILYFSSFMWLELLDFSKKYFLWRSIPQEGKMAAFTNSSYLYNANWWGCPLAKKCQWPKFSPSPPISIFVNEEKQSKESVWYWIGVGLSYGVGFVAVVFIVLKRKWGHIYFKG